jgi:hypothetical protein
MFADAYDAYAAQIGAALDALAQVRIMSGELETLRSMKNDINEFEAQVDSLRRALMDILDNVEDLRLLYLTKVRGEAAISVVMIV